MEQIKNGTGEPEFVILASVMGGILILFIAVQTLKEYSHLSSKPRQLSVTAYPVKSQ